MRRFSSDGKVLHPPISHAPGQSPKMYSARTARVFIPSRSVSYLVHMSFKCLRRLYPSPEPCAAERERYVEVLRGCSHSGIISHREAKCVADEISGAGDATLA